MLQNPFNKSLIRAYWMLSLIISVTTAHGKKEQSSDNLSSFVDTEVIGSSDPSEIVSYFRSKSIDLSALNDLFIDPSAVQRADNIIDNKFFVIDQEYDVKLKEDGFPDWSWLGPDKDKEWGWMFNRTPFLNELYGAYQITGNDLYIEKLDALWNNWISTSPYPDRLTFSTEWRALEVARRILGSWIHLFYKLQNHPALRDETRLLILNSMYDHADALRNHYSFWGGNHLITEKTALLAISYAFPEFKDADEWERFAIDALSREFSAQSYKDGSFKELSNHYQRVILVNARQFLKLLLAMDKEAEELPVYQQIVRMWEFFAGVMRPGGFGPLNNAADLEKNSFFLKEAAADLKRQDWHYIATEGKEGTVPEIPPSQIFPYAGQVIFRDSWRADSHWGYFDAGPYGSAHQHIDHLHFSCSFSDQLFLTDTGRYSYMPGDLNSYFKGPTAHNALIINGKAPSQGPHTVEAPMPITFEKESDYILTSASTIYSADGFSLNGPTQWRRSIIYLYSGIWIIIDQVETFSNSEVQAIWNFAPPITNEEAGKGLRLLRGPNHEIETYKGQRTPFPAGYYSPDYGILIPSLQKRFKFSINKPTTLIWLISDPFDSFSQVSDAIAEKISHKEVQISIQTEIQTTELRLDLRKVPKVIEIQKSN